jgi:VanZ family protein
LAGLLYFPAKVGFHVTPRACELALDANLARISLQNYAHIVMFGAFYILSYGQFRRSRSPFVLAGIATLIMGALVELAEGFAGTNHCRLRDLVPDSIGAMLGALVVLLFTLTLRQLGGAKVSPPAA